MAMLVINDAAFIDLGKLEAVVRTYYKSDLWVTPEVHLLVSGRRLVYDYEDIVYGRGKPKVRVVGGVTDEDKAKIEIIDKAFDWLLFCSPSPPLTLCLRAKRDITENTCICKEV